MHILSRGRLDEFPTKANSFITRGSMYERVDLFPSESVCLVWKHNPLEHETLEGKLEKGGTGNSSEGSSLTGVGKGEGDVNGTNCGGK